MDLDEVIAGMSEAQKNILYFPDGYHNENAMKTMRRKGLVWGIILTQLGLAVRARLLAKETDSG